DNCSTPANITVSNDAPATFPKRDTSVTWTAKDESCNTQTCTQKVTVLDDEKPSILCPADVTAHTSDDGTGNCSTTATLGSPTVSDNCSTPANITVSNDAPATYPLLTRRSSEMAKDESGNTQTCTQK